MILFFFFFLVVAVVVTLSKKKRKKKERQDRAMADKTGEKKLFFLIIRLIDFNNKCPNWQWGEQCACGRWGLEWGGGGWWMEQFCWSWFSHETLPSPRRPIVIHRPRVIPTVVLVSSLTFNAKKQFSVRNSLCCLSKSFGRREKDAISLIQMLGCSLRWATASSGGKARRDRVFDATLFYSCSYIQLKCLVLVRGRGIDKYSFFFFFFFFFFFLLLLLLLQW